MGRSGSERVCWGGVGHHLAGHHFHITFGSILAGGSTVCISSIVGVVQAVFLVNRGPLSPAKIRSGKTDPVKFTGAFKQGPFCL